MSAGNDHASRRPNSFLRRTPGATSAEEAVAPRPAVVLDPGEEERGAVVEAAAADHPAVSKRPEVGECLRCLGAIHAKRLVRIVGKIQVPAPRRSPPGPPGRICRCPRSPIRQARYCPRPCIPSHRSSSRTPRDPSSVRVPSSPTGKTAARSHPPPRSSTLPPSAAVSRPRRRTRTPRPSRCNPHRQGFVRSRLVVSTLWKPG